MKTWSIALPTLRGHPQFLMLLTLIAASCVPGGSALDRPTASSPAVSPTAVPQIVALAAASQTNAPQVVASPAAPDIAASATLSLYLPALLNNYPPHTIFGVQMNTIGDTSGLQQVLNTQTSWVRSSVPVAWSDIQPQEGSSYNWSALAGNEQEWLQASANHLSSFVMIRSTPAWAQAVPGYACGPVKSTQLAAFGNFLHALVARYSQAPYNLKYWEIGNEPDIDYHLVPGDSAWGCWGNAQDAYYGGGYYADMLKVVYPQIKSADPNAQVLVAGLLLDCDPNHPPSGRDCTPARFLEGVLREGGGPYFDGVGIHAYDYYTNVLGGYTNSNWNTSSTNTSGPTMALAAKADYVRGLLAAYGVGGKFVADNESALLWNVANADDTYETTKAYCLVESYATALAEHLLTNIWYSTDDDSHHEALFGPGLAPRPAFVAYQFASQQLGAAQYSQAVTGYAGVKGYIFSRRLDSLWLLWSQDGAVHLLTLPGVPTSVHHTDGTVLAVSTNQLSLGPEPLYVQWSN